jgi:release factor glutamine methyltransferase
MCKTRNKNFKNASFKMKLVSSPNVYEPQEDSRLMQELVVKYAFGDVLDMGTGSGILAIAAAGNPRVKSVLAADINIEALRTAERNARLNRVKIKTVKSDLFSNIRKRFDFIIFNPPYLPEDKNAPKDILERALSGGRKGYETLERFIKGLSSHLNADGKALIIFSSMTGREKIEDIIKENLFSFEVVGIKKIPFEELYALLISKTEILKGMERSGIRMVGKIAKGHRGIVYLGMLGRKKVAVKIRNPDSRAVCRIENEVKFLKILGRGGFKVPMLRAFGDGFLAEDFVEGICIEDYLYSCTANEALNLLTLVLRECRKLDMEEIEKEEMHRPVKHIIIRGGSSKNPDFVMIDFERAHFSEKPSNTTQFCQFIISRRKILEAKAIAVDPEEMKRACIEYKRTFSEESFQKIVQNLRKK